jgi:G3E family GTPase
MLGEFYVAQIENADIVIINKMDLVTRELDAVSAQIREINADADILFAEQCDVDTDIFSTCVTAASLRVLVTQTAMDQGVRRKMDTITTTITSTTRRTRMRRRNRLYSSPAEIPMLPK